jgi:hypothetical protein
LVCIATEKLTRLEHVPRRFIYAEKSFCPVPMKLTDPAYSLGPVRPSSV